MPNCARRRPPLEPTASRAPSCPAALALAAWQHPRVLLSLLFALAAAEAPEPVQSPERVDARIVRGTSSVRFDGRAGGSVGNVLLVPFATPGPGASLAVDGELTFLNLAFTHLDIAASMGFSQSGDPVPLAGYRAMGAAGLRQQGRFAGLGADVHAGITSFALIPLPRYGVGADLAVILVNWGGFSWEIKARGDLDLLVIAPAPSASLTTALRWRSDDGWFAVRGGVAGDAIVAVLVNTLGAQVFVGVEAGFGPW